MGQEDAVREAYQALEQDYGQEFLRIATKEKRKLQPGITILDDNPESVLFIYSDATVKPCGVLKVWADNRKVDSNFPGGIYDIFSFTVAEERKQGSFRALLAAAEEWMQTRVNQLGKGLFISKIGIPKNLPETHALSLGVISMLEKRGYEETSDFCFEKKFAPAIME